MMSIIQSLHRVPIILAKRQVCLEFVIKSQSLIPPENTLGSTLHPNCLPSQLIIQSYKSTNAKNNNARDIRTYRRYTPEEDQRLLEHIKVHGKTQSSFNDIAAVLGRSVESVQYRSSKLLSDKYFDANTHPKHWDYEEDEKLVNRLFKLKKINPNNISLLLDVKISDFKEIVPDLKRSTNSVYGHWKEQIVPLLEPHLDDLKTSKSLREDVAKIIESRHEKSTTLRGYSENDKKFIIKQVQLKGDVPKTWVFLAKKVGKKNPALVRIFYLNHILKTPKVKGSFTPEEDEIIIRHVNENGTTQKSFRDLAKELGRGSASSVQSRYNKIVSLNEFEVNTKRKAWELDEDKSLMDHVFNIKEIKAGDASSIENVKPSEFTVIATELKRSSNSCHTRWMKYIAPTLKTHLMKLPMTNDWKKDVLSYIVNNNIKHKKEIDIDRFLKEVAPGQTSASVLSYLEVLKRETVNGVNKPSKLPLSDLASKRLKEQEPCSALFNENHRGEQKRLEWCEDVISYYKTLI